MSNIENNKRIARNTLFLYIRMGVVMLIALYTTRVVLKVLGADDYGTYNVVCGFVSMFGIFNTSFSTSINRFYNYAIGKKTKNGVRIVYNSAILIQILLALIVVSVVEFVGCWYIDNVMVLSAERHETAKWIFHFAMFSMFLTIIQAPYSAAVMAYEKMNFYAIVSVLDAFFKLGFIFMLQYIGSDKLLLYGVLMCLISILNFLLYYIYCQLMFSEIRLHRVLNKNMIKSMLSFAGWSALDPAAYMVRDQGTNMVLNSFFGPIVNAAQGIAYQVATAVDNFGGSFSTSFRPQIIQSYSEGQYKRTKNLMLSMSKLSYMLHAMIIIPIIIEIQYILNFWLGEGFPNYTVIFTCLILIIKGIGSLNSPISTVVSATGNIRRIKMFSAIIISSIIPISIILFELGYPPMFAYVALFFLTVINQMVCVIILHQVFPYIKTMEYVKQLIWPLFIYTVSVALLPILIGSILPSTIWRLILVFVISIACGSFAGYFVVLNRTEQILIQTFAKSFLGKIRLEINKY